MKIVLKLSIDLNINHLVKRMLILADFIKSLEGNKSQQPFTYFVTEYDRMSNLIYCSLLTEFNPRLSHFTYFVIITG